MDKISTKVAGIDTGKASLDMATYPAGDRLKVANTAEGWQRLADRLKADGIGRVGIEASGGYERGVIAALRRAGLDVVLLQPRQVRAFGVYRGRRAKTDRIDAALIAECTANCNDLRPPPDSRLAPLCEWLLFIEQIEADIARFKTRREHFTDTRILKQIDREIAASERKRNAELARLQAAIRTQDDLARRLDLIESIDGIGMRTALTLLILMPELGAVDREEIAALAGVAPYDDQSGKRDGARHIAGGRARVRRAVFNSTLPAAMRWNTELMAFYQRLIAAGKPHTLALIACARKLLIFANTVVKRQTPWVKNSPPKPIAV
jgi:transposase